MLARVTGEIPNMVSLNLRKYYKHLRASPALEYLDRTLGKQRWSSKDVAGKLAKKLHDTYNPQNSYRQ